MPGLPVPVLPVLNCLSGFLLGCAAAFRGGRHSLPFAGAIILGVACALTSPVICAAMLLVNAQSIPPPDVFDGRGYVAAAFAGACAGYLLQRHVHENILFFPALDAASLALATALGTHVALAFGPAGAVGGVIIGCMAGSAGGVLRDLCLTERPALLEADFYGAAAVVGAMGVAGMHTLQAGLWEQMLVGGGCAFGLRLLGSRRMRRAGFSSEF